MKTPKPEKERREGTVEGSPPGGPILIPVGTAQRTLCCRDTRVGKIAARTLPLGALNPYRVVSAALEGFKKNKNKNTIISPPQNKMEKCYDISNYKNQNEP